MRKALAAIVVATALIISAAACGDAELVGCAASEHEGLLCWLGKEPVSEGRCYAGECVPLGCTTDAECGEGPCEIYTCTISSGEATGECSKAVAPDGAVCTNMGQPGVCAAGHCK